MLLRQWLTGISFVVWIGASGWGSAASPELVAPIIPVGATIPLSGHESLLTINTLRENYNAHDFVVTFFVVQDQDDPEVPLRLVPVFEQHREQTQLTSRQGADCILADFKVMQIESTVHLWRADREIGEDYLAPQPIRVRHYTLQHNAAEVPGRPRYYFEWLETTTARESACDVGAALDDAVLALTSARD